jgi:hypothetical protein
MEKLISFRVRAKVSNLVEVPDMPDVGLAAVVKTARDFLENGIS